MSGKLIDEALLSRQILDFWVCHPICAKSQLNMKRNTLTHQHITLDTLPEKVLRCSQMRRCDKARGSISMDLRSLPTSNFLRIRATVQAHSLDVFESAEKNLTEESGKHIVFFGWGKMAIENFNSLQNGSGGDAQCTNNRVCRFQPDEFVGCQEANKATQPRGELSLRTTVKHLHFDFSSGPQMHRTVRESLHIQSLSIVATLSFLPGANP